MGFVQTGFLAALGALAIPIVIHMIFRRRQKQVPLGTLRFLNVVLKENARRRRVKRWLLLALRLACVALLAFLFARPYLSASAVPGGKRRFAALLIDQSASMQLREGGARLIDRAVEQAGQLISRGGDDLDVEIAFFDHAVYPVTAEDGARITPGDLSPPEVSYGGTSHGAAMAWARDVCVKSDRPDREIHVWTDLQRSGLDWTDKTPFPAEIELHLHDLGRALVNNAAVTSVQTSRKLVRPGETVSVKALIFNSSPLPLDKIPVTLRLSDGARQRLHHESVAIEAGAATTVEFQIENLERGQWTGDVEIDAQDDLPFDNRRHFAVTAAPPEPVLLVDGAPHETPLLSETYFLEAALRLAPPGEVNPDSPYRPQTVILPAGAVLPDLESFEIVVLANVGRLPAVAVRQLSRFVEEGGGLVVFCGENVRADAYATFESAGLTAGEIVGNRRAAGLPFRLEDWEAKHSIFAPFDDPQYGNLRRLSFHGYTKIKPRPEARVLAAFRGSAPALIEHQHKNGTVIWFTSSCDGEWGGWVRSRLYLPLIHQILGSLSGLTEGGPVREITLDEFEPKAGEPVPGVYERDRFLQVVNVSPRESETDRCTPAEFAARFPMHLHQERPRTHAADPAAAALSPGLRINEIWHWLVLVLAGVLFLECFLANRTAA